MALIRNKWGRIAVVLWVLLAIGASTGAIVSPGRQHFQTTYRPASLKLLEGVSMYGDADPPFRAGPTFATLVTPLAMFPPALGNVLWTLLSLGLLVFAIQQLARWVLPGIECERALAVLFLLVLPAAIRGPWSSQAHTLTAALLFLGVVGIARGRWWQAALCLSLAAHVKLAPIAVGLVFVALRPRKLAFRYFVCFVLLGLTSFVVVGPAFAAAEHVQWIGYLQDSAGNRWVAFGDAWHLWELTPIPFNLTVYRVVQVLAGLGTLAWCWWLARRSDLTGTTLSLCLALVASYNLVFGPAVEFNQYVVIGPLVAWAVLKSFQEARPKGLILAAYTMSIIVGGGALERSLRAAVDTPWVTAFGTLGVMLFSVWIILHGRDHRLRESSADEGDAELT